MLRSKTQPLERRRWPCSHERRPNCCEKPCTPKNCRRTTCVTGGSARKVAGKDEELTKHVDARGTANAAPRDQDGPRRGGVARQRHVRGHEVRNTTQVDRVETNG